MVFHDIHRSSQNSPGTRRIASLYAIPGLLAWGNAHDRIVIVGMFPVEIEAHAVNWLRPKSQYRGMPMHEPVVDVPGCEVVDVGDFLVSIAVSDPRPEFARDIPYQLNLVSFPVLVKRSIGRGSGGDLRGLAERSQQIAVRRAAYLARLQKVRALRGSKRPIDRTCQPSASAS